MKKVYLVLLFILLCLSLIGCTYEADRVYTICAVRNGNTYCYNDTGFYILNNETGYLIPVKGYGFVKNPILKLLPTQSKDYRFENSLPGLYEGTLESVSNYINYLESEYGATTEIVEADSKSIEVLSNATDFNTRIVFNIRGEVRIYSADANGEAITPLGLE